MTQRTKDTLKILIPFVGTIFVVGLAWGDIKHQTSDALPKERFVTDSVRRDGSFTILLNYQLETREAIKELSSRMLEVCVELKGKAGCR